jgi:hypothetical protein
VSVPKRNEYPAGVQCWIDTAQPDPGAAVDFYGGLFGWKFENMMPPDSPQPYLMGRLSSSRRASKDPAGDAWSPRRQSLGKSGLAWLGWYRLTSLPPGRRSAVIKPKPSSLISLMKSTPLARSSSTVAPMSSHIR